MAGKYINLSDLLAVNLVQREPEPQLVRWSTGVDFPAKKTAATHQGHRFVDGGLCHLFPHPGLSLSKPLERSYAVPVADPEDLPLAERGSRMIKLSVSTPPLRSSPTGLL